MINHIKNLSFLARKLKKKKNIIEKRKGEPQDETREDGNEEEEDFHDDCDLSFNSVLVGGGLSSHV
jgi:hypothetical protein